MLPKLEAITCLKQSGAGYKWRLYVDKSSASRFYILLSVIAVVIADIKL